MTTISDKQRKEFFYLCRVLGIDHAERFMLVNLYSEGVTSSVAKDSPMAQWQMEKMLVYLRQLQQSKLAKGNSNYAEEQKELKRQLKESTQAMRKKIFSMCYKAGFISYSSDEEEKKMNQAKVYGLVRRQGYLKPKEFMEYSYEELPRLVSQFESMARNNAATAYRKAEKEAEGQLGGMLEQLGMYVEPKNTKNDERN